MFGSSSSRSLALLVLLLAAPSWAQVTYPPPSWSTDDVITCANPSRIEAPSSAFSLTNPSVGVCQFDLSANVTLAGAVVGDVAGESVFLDGGTTDQTCGSGNQGKHRVLDTGVLQYCGGDTASDVRVPALASGLTGGQTWYGGTATTDGLSLNPSSASDARGSINMCASNADIGDQSTACMTAFVNGLTIGNGQKYRGMSVTSTVRQDANGDSFGTPIGYLFEDTHTHELASSVSSPTIIGSQVALLASATLKNANAATVSTATALGDLGPGWVAVYSSPIYSNTGGGAMTNAREVGLSHIPGTIPSGVTVTRSYGTYTKSPTATGTLTHAYGNFANIATGTNQHPFGAAEATPTGSTESGVGDFGIDNTGLFYSRDDSQVIRRLRGTAPAAMKLGGVKFDMGSGNSITTSDSFVFRLEAFDGTITGIECEAYSGTSFTIKVCSGEDAADDTCTTNLLSSTESTTLVCDTTGAADTALNSATFSARGKASVVITAVSGTVQTGEVYLYGTAS